MQPNPNQSASQFITIVNRELFFRILEGRFDAAQDRQQIEKLLQLAQNLQSNALLGAIHSTAMLLNYSLGQLDEAFAATEDAIRAYERDDNPKIRLRAIGIYNNQAEMYHDYGNPQSALAISDQILQRISDPLLAADVRGTQLYFANRGMYHLSAGQPEEAAAIFEHVLTQNSNTDDQYGEALGTTHRGLATVRLLHAEYQLAFDSAKLALEIASRDADPVNQFYAHTTLAHIAEQDSTGAHDPSTYYDAAFEDMLRIGSPMFRGITLLHERRYHLRQNNIVTANRFGDYARNVFEAAGIHAFDHELR